MANGIDFEKMATRFMGSETYFFSDIKEKRETYFVGYLTPRRPHQPFALLQITFLAPVTDEHAAATLEEEARAWLRRYPVPLMATSFDDKEHTIYLPERDTSSLAGWLDNGEPRLSWQITDLDIQAHPLPDDLRPIYHGVPYETRDARVANKADGMKRHRSEVLSAKFTILMWAVVLPLVVAVLEFFAPTWVAVLVLVYAFWKAVQQWRLLTGRSKPSAADIGKREIERRKDHYFYHCERNPDGFRRLRAENADREARERVQRETADIGKEKP